VCSSILQVIWVTTECSIYIPVNLHGLGYTDNVRRVPYHHDMERPHVADGGDCHQLWRVAMNTLNNQPRTADQGMVLKLGGGREAKRPLTVKISLLQNFAMRLGLGRIPWVNDLSYRIWI
jgi:hypothetical protein